MHHRLVKLIGTVAALLAGTALLAGVRPPGPGRPGTPVPGQKVPIKPPEDFQPKVYKDPNGKELPYRLLEPVKDLDPNQPFPLVLVLHGANMAGTDNKIQLRCGVLELFGNKQVQSKHPCYVVVPQCPPDGRWVAVNSSVERHTMREIPTTPMRLVLEMLDAFQKEVVVDANHVYVIGMSMGGFGTWDIISRKPDMFAAAVPISGGGDEARAADIAKIPIWAFHGDSDNVVSPEWSRRMVEAIRQAGGEPKYTEYKGTGQGAFARAFADPNLLEWLFAQERPGPTTQPTQPASGPATRPATQPGVKPGPFGSL